MLARRIFLAGILAGIVAGAFVTLIQAVKIWPLIAAAEVYEKAGKAAATASGGHAGHDRGAAPATATEWEPADGPERILFTLLANILVAIGFGLLLSAGFALRDAYAGAPPDAMSGVGWGMAGFAAFQLPPAFGLAPQPPRAGATDHPAPPAWVSAAPL